MCPPLEMVITTMLSVYNLKTLESMKHDQHNKYILIKRSFAPVNIFLILIMPSKDIFQINF